VARILSWNDPVSQEPYPLRIGPSAAIVYFDVRRIACILLRVFIVAQTVADSPCAPSSPVEIGSNFLQKREGFSVFTAVLSPSNLILFGLIASAFFLPKLMKSLGMFRMGLVLKSV
jgi:hypothetical protein